MKQCIRCGEFKLIDEFKKDKKCKDGHRNICKECVNKYQRDYLKRSGYYRTEKYRIYAAQYRSENREKIRRYAREYRRRHKENINKERSIRRQRLKMEVIKVLGGVCSNCGFNDPRALTIHHIHGTGREERRVFVDRTSYWQNILSEIQRGSGNYQLLCANCHLIIEGERNSI